MCLFLIFKDQYEVQSVCVNDDEEMNPVTLPVEFPQSGEGVDGEHQHQNHFDQQLCKKHQVNSD